MSSVSDGRIGTNGGNFGNGKLAILCQMLYMQGADLPEMPRMLQNPQMQIARNVAKVENVAVATGLFS
ncbi:MAG: hypothetical protein JNM70_11065 [Anaerolineae bacterium]|nr:hypothetical protein [Anaerolineae bacterium]